MTENVKIIHKCIQQIYNGNLLKAMNIFSGSGYTALDQIQEPINSWQLYILAGERNNKKGKCVCICVCYSR